MHLALQPEQVDVLVALSTRRLRTKDLVERLKGLPTAREHNERTVRAAVRSLVDLGLAVDTAAILGERGPKWTRTDLGDMVAAQLITSATIQANQTDARATTVSESTAR